METNGKPILTLRKESFGSQSILGFIDHTGVFGNKLGNNGMY